MTTNRREFITAGTALLLAPVVGAKQASSTAQSFPPGFMWGVSTAGHQVEGNNVASDVWLMEHTQPTLFEEPSGDACNSFALWPTDLDLVRNLGLNTYRFSIEWSRIEPEQGQMSLAMLDHYKRVIAGCRERGLTPMVTFNHYTCPRWFAAQGGWTNPAAVDLFARYCETAARYLAAEIGYATTLNEPNVPKLIRWFGLPDDFYETLDAMLVNAGKAVGASHFTLANVASRKDAEAMQPIMIAAHKKGYAAIKSVRPDLPVGVSLAISDDQAVGRGSRRDELRADAYGPWLEAAKTGDFLGVQNYARMQIDSNGLLPPPKGATLNAMGDEIYPRSLGNAVSYAYAATGLPIIVTENGLAIDDDTLRVSYIHEVLQGLHAVMSKGVPVKGYIHWSLLDNFEWSYGYSKRFGLFSVDRKTFKRTAKPSAAVLGDIAHRNAL